MTEATSALFYRLRRLAVQTFVVVTFFDSVYLTFRDAHIVWPSSWALDARWPWWFHALVAVGFYYWWRELRSKA